jgi:hypothetical protein
MAGAPYQPFGTSASAETRSGYVDIQFDSLLMPDGAIVSIEAAATDLDLRPLKGKVEGQMSDDFGSEEPSLSASAGMNSTVLSHSILSRQTNVILHVTMM